VPSFKATVASRPKNLQNNSKLAEKRKSLAERISGDTAAIWTKALENRQKKYFMKK
jgi:hypothetical protein